jgi:hypothetical protein
MNRRQNPNINLLCGKSQRMAVLAALVSQWFPPMLHRQPMSILHSELKGWKPRSQRNYQFLLFENHPNLNTMS